MVATSKIFPVLLSIRRFLIRAFQGGFMRQALKWLLRRLAFYWAALRSRSSTSGRKTQTITAPLPPKCTDSSYGETIGPSEAQQIQKQALNLDSDYITITGGEIVSLEDVMPSVYPHAGDGINSAIQSTKNLSVSRSAHSSRISLSLSREPSVLSRSQSRLSINDHGSQRSGSQYSNSIISVNIIAPQDSPTSVTQKVAFTENRRATRSDRSPYLQPINTTSQSLSSPSRQSDRLSGTTSPTLENEDLNPSLSHAGSPTNDDQHSVKSFNPKAGYEVDELVHGSPPLKKTSLDAISSPPSPSPSTVLGHRCIIPVMPEAIPRYADRPVIAKSGSSIKDAIQPLTQNFDRPGSPDGWTKYIHPEGACYFFNPTKRIYAEANLHDETVYSYLKEVITLIEDFIALHDIKEIDNDTDLVIHLAKDSDGEFFSLYYYVHHRTRSIFFLDEYEANSLEAWRQIHGGASSESHLGNEIETQYWFHCQFFPHSSTLTKEKVQELRDVVMHYIGDTMTSPKCSTAPYSLEELRNVLALTSDMDQNVGGVSVGTHSCFARLMFIFCRARFLHYHGEPHARIDRTTSVYGENVYRRTWLVKTLSPILFCAPDFHLKNLQGMWVDEIMHKSVFNDSMERMNSDWDRIVLFATVMLNANVAFLAIQSVDNNGHPQRSATQIASYVSMITSIGSIVLGLLLSRQNRTKLRETVDEFEKYMTDRRHPTLGLETLAILYSLPYALLMWGMLSFLLAVTFLCFMDSDTPTVSIVAVSSFFCVAFCLWCVYTNWEKEDNEEWKFSETKIGGRLSKAMIKLKPPFHFNFGRRRSNLGPQQLA